MIHGKGLGGKYCSRVGINLTNRMDSNLKRLAVSCNKSKAEFSRLIIERCISDPAWVAQIQKEYNVDPEYWVMPVNRRGDVELVVRGREQ
mgnify:CR=1 FL=1